jgi:hypothetical protein
MQLGFVALAYGAAFLVAVAILYARHLQELRYPDDAAGGMWAFGDLFLWVFIAGLFMIPSVFLVLVIAKFESFYITYSRILLALSLTGPICLSIFVLASRHLSEGVGSLFLYRFFGSPFIFVGISVSRMAARFERSKWPLTFALVVEGLTFAVSIALLVLSWGATKGH